MRCSYYCIAGIERCRYTRVQSGEIEQHRVLLRNDLSTLRSASSISTFVCLLPSIRAVGCMVVNLHFLYLSYFRKCRDPRASPTRTFWQDGYNSLHLAAQAGFLENVAVLISRGADVRSVRHFDDGRSVFVS